MMNKKIRNHYSSIIEDMLKFFWSIILFVVIFTIDFIKEIKTSSLDLTKAFIFIGIFLLVVLIVFIIYFIKWYKTTIMYNSSTIVIDRNTILRKTINIKDISKIDISQNIIEKLFNTAKVQLDIKSVVTAEDNDFKIILKYDEALEFQRNILNLMNKNTLLDNETKIELDNYDYKYNFKEIIRHTILSANIVLLLFSIISIPLIFFDEYDKSTLFIGFLVVIIPILFNIVKVITNYYDLKINKEDNKINITYGYFTRKKVSVPYKKISGIKITQPLLARIFKLYSVELINIGYAEDNIVSLLLPLDKINETNKRLEYLFPGLKLDYSANKQPKNSIIAYIIDNIIFIILSIIIVFPINTIFGIVFIFIWMISIFLSYKTKSISYEDKTLYITKGIYNKTTIVCNLDNIQNITICNNIFIKKFKINKMKIILRSNLLNSNHETGYFNKSIFDEIIKDYN